MPGLYSNRNQAQPASQSGGGLYSSHLKQQKQVNDKVWELGLDPVSTMKATQTFTSNLKQQNEEAKKRAETQKAEQKAAAKAAKDKAIKDLRAEHEKEYAKQPWLINKINSALDKFTYETKLGRFVSGVSQGAMTATTGLQPEQNGDVSVGSNAAHTIGGFVGPLANPAMIPGGMLSAPYKATATQTIAGAVGSRLSNPLAAKAATEATREALVGGGLGGAQSLMLGQTSPKELVTNIGAGAGLGILTAGAGSAVKAGLQRGVNSLSDALANVKSEQAKAIIRAMHQVHQENPTLALPERATQPEARVRGNANTAETPEVIYGTGKVKNPEPLALGSGSFQRSSNLRVSGNNHTLDKVMNQVKPIVTERMTPPLENPSELARWVQSNLKSEHGIDASLNEVRQMPYEDLRQIAEFIRSGMDTKGEAVKAARELGYDLDSLLNGETPSIRQRVSQDAQARTYGVYPDSLPKVRTPQFSVQHGSGAAAPVERVGRSLNANLAPKKAAIEPTVQPVEKVVKSAQQVAERTPQHTPLTRPHVDDATVATGTGTVSDELKFAQTVKNAETTPPELLKAMEENPMTGGRTSNTLNQQAAQALIKRHGAEKLKDMIIGKRGQLSPAENTAAQILAKYYSNLGGDENLSKAVDIISKTARSGRELGQAIQALSQWNKLSAEGVMMLGERQVNRRIANVEDRVKLTTEQAKPLQEVGQKIEDVQGARNLADEVVKMLASRDANAPLSDAEKSLIKQFDDQVKQVSEKVKPLLKTQKEARDAVIREVGAIKPKDRTRDQVVNFLDAQAARAREKLNKQKSVGIIADTENPVILHAIIGASHIARGVVKFADWSEAMIKEGITEKLPEVYTKAVQRFRKENGLPTNDELNKVVTKAMKDGRIDEETSNSLRAMASEIGFYTDDVKKELTQDLQRVLQQLGDPTLGERIAATQTASMLLNVPTFLRNAIGNTVQLTTEKFNKLAAVPIDWTLSKLTGERTIQFFPQNQEKFWRNFAIGTKAGWQGVSPTGTLSSFDVHPEVFKSKYNPLRYMVKATGASLQGFDHAAYNAAYGDVLATYAEQMGKAQGLTRAQIKQQMPELLMQLDDRVYQLADQAGLYATYQDETMLSRAALSVKRALNKPTDALFGSLRQKGIIPEKYSLEGFGLGDVVLKFTRTPANIVMRGIDYSPLGILRGLWEILPLVTGKGFNQFAATRSLSRAITGTIGFSGMGFLLANNGILTGASSFDPDMRSIQEQSGSGTYKVNLSALRRWIMSGLDSDAAKVREGDQLMDYSWIQPVAISVAMGVDAANTLDKPLKPGEHRSYAKSISQAAIGGLRTVMENPMLTGLTDVADATTSLIKNQDASKFGNLIKGVPATFIPTVVGQQRTATDNYQRETFDKNILTNVLNLVKNKIPGQSKLLPISYDSLGNPREKIQGGKNNSLGQYLNAYLNPAKLTRYTVSPEAKSVLDVMNATGDTSILPRIAQKSLQVDKKSEGLKNVRLNLNAQQFSILQKRLGELVTQGLDKSSDYLSNPQISDEKKAKRISDILTDAGSKARNELRTSLGYDKKK